MPELNDVSGDVIARLKGGDPHAFGEVFSTWNHRLMRYVSVLIPPKESADLVAEVWLQVFRDLQRFTGTEAEFAAWVTVIARNKALEHSGRTSLLTGLGFADVPDHQDEDCEEEQLEGLGTATAMRLIRTLPADQAEAVMLRAVMGLSSKLAGEVLGRRPGAIRLAAHTGLKAIEAELSQLTVAHAEPTTTRSVE